MMGPDYVFFFAFLAIFLSALVIGDIIYDFILYLKSKFEESRFRDDGF